MKRILSIVLSLLMIFSVLTVNIVTVNAEDNQVNQTFLDRVRSDFDLVWSDEFNDDTLDTTKWKLDGQLTRRNSELQIYADSMEDGNLQFDGQSAVIVPKIEPRVSQDGRKYKYTSAEISTQGIQSWKYGYFEIRAKQACGKNIVPAIWMMGYDHTSGSCDWPYSGEIDIMERLNSDKATESTLHHTTYGNRGNAHHKATGIGGQSYDHKINEQFHNYWLFWTDKYLIAGVDDSMHTIVDITKPDLAQSFRTFEHWLIINVAMGMFANPVNEAEEDQWKMWIDHVRVYQLNDDKLYDNYKAFSTLDLKNNGSEYAYGKTVSTLKGEPSLDFTIQDELTPGKYDIYTEIGNKDMVTYINGVQTNEISKIDHGKAVGNQAFVGSVDLQDQSNFDVTFKAKDGSSVSVEKLIFIKTDENKSTPVIVNKDTNVTVSDYIEVSNEDELKSAISHITEKGTIKLLNDITLTKRIYTFNEPTIDLNGKTLTVNGGYLAISDENKPSVIKNGNVIISGKSSNFIHTKENNYNAKVKCEDLNITINSTASSGYVFNHSYGGINIEANNCEFTFGEKVSSTSNYIISRNAGIYNNCTFNLNGRKAFLLTNGSNTSPKKLYFNNCVVNDALYLFHSDNALTQYVDVKLANTTLNNLGALTNHAENVQFVSVADNGILKQNGETVGISADMTGNFTMECNHYYIDATCLFPKHCEYCFKEEGVALEHNIVTDTTPADCVYAGSIKTYCDKCSTVFSEKVLPVTDHNYELVETFEPTCKMAGYHLWACSHCGMKQQRSYNGDGAVIKLPHNPDTSRTTVKEPTCTMGGYTQNYCLDCGSAYKTNLKHSSDHDCTETIDYDAGAIIYDCKNCDYTAVREGVLLEHEYTANELASCSKLISRAYKDTDDVVLAMSGSGVEYGIFVEGDVKVKLNNTAHKANAKNYLGVMIDGDYQNRKLIEISSGDNEITVATDLQAGEHTIMLWHPNEYSYSTYRIKSLTFTGKKSKAPAKKKYTIDFYGDSITVGQGNVPLGEDGTYKTNTSDALDSYAGVVGRELDADINICAASGYGIAYGFNENTNPAGGIISKIYDYASPKDKLLWDYDAYTPDLAVVSLGQNDLSHKSNVGDVDYQQELRIKIKDLIEKIRANDKTVPIVFIGGLMNTDGSFSNEFINIRKSVSEVVNENKYNDIYFKIIKGDSAGGNYHPSAKAHKSVGETLANYIETLDLFNDETKVISPIIDDFNNVSSVPSRYSGTAEIVDSPVADDNHGKVLKIDAKQQYSGISFNTTNMPENTIGIKFDIYVTKNATFGVMGKNASNKDLYGSASSLSSICANNWITVTDVIDTRLCSAEDIASFKISTNWSTADTIYIDNISYLVLGSNICSHIAHEGHDKVVPPTCAKDGYTEHLCSLCGERYTDSKVLATGNHIADESKDKVVAPTCKEKGYTQRYCTVCKNTYKTDETAINPDAHNPQVSKAVESTCTKTGLTEGSYCSWCNKILVAQEETPKKPHTEFVSRKGYEATCKNAGYTDEISCSVCKTVIVERERLPLLEHTEVIDMPREATCSQTGLTKGSHCSVCGEIIIAQVESPKTPHAIVVDRGFAATCEKAGLTNGKHCSVCGEITLAQKEITKLPHIVGNWEIISESERVKKCLVCNTVVESEEITAICVHLTVIKNAKKATYFATGYTGDLVCIKCNKTITAGSITAKLTLKVPKFKLIKGKKQFKVKYTKVKDATGFQVRYRIKGKWKTKTFNTKKTATKVVKKLKKGNYQVQIRAMIVSGKQKAYSAWSKSKKVKVK